MIVTAVDNVLHYQNCMRAFLMSLAVNAPEEIVHVHLMNCAEEYAAEIRGINRNVEITTEITLEERAEVRNYIRHTLLLKLSYQHKFLVWMDNDCIVRGRLAGIYDGVEADVVKFWHKPEKHKKYQFQGGVYVIGSGTRVQNWLSLIIAELSNRNDWLAPQEVMIDRLQALCIDTVPLGIGYNDSTFQKGSLVWHCKHGHFEEPAYQKEYQQYLRLSCEKKN